MTTTFVPDNNDTASVSMSNGRGYAITATPVRPASDPGPLVHCPTPLLLEAPSGSKVWRLRITVDGQSHVFEGKRITVDGYAAYDVGPDGETLAAGQLAQQTSIQWTDAPGGAATADTAPKVGDLHPWDALVDGCLYYDEACTDSRPYLVKANGGFMWAGCPQDVHHEWPHVDVDGDFPRISQKADKALVIAVGLNSCDQFEHAVGLAQLGGPK
jgi:hypothetical protein